MRCSAWRWSGPLNGSRRISRELHQRGWMVNRKRVQRMMREDNLLCLRHRRFVVTTDSNHDLPVYPNLAQTMVLTDINQLWRADITYLRLAEEFVYLAVILDAYSRRVIGWALDRRLSAELTILAGEMALAQRGAPAGLVHHSDLRGTVRQSRLHPDPREHGIRISMSRTGNPWDNAACESFMKTLKYEEVYRSEYRDLADAYARIGEFLEVIYNQKRLHRPGLPLAGPVRAFFADDRRGGGGAGVSFPRHGEIYPCDRGTILRPCPRPSPWMSLQPVIPGGLLSSRARVRFTGRRHALPANGCRATETQQTVNCGLLGCLSPGVHRKRQGWGNLNMCFVGKGGPVPRASQCGAPGKMCFVEQVGQIPE